MGRVVVIGATGHIGAYLVPRLVRAGHEVIAVSRGEREPYQEAVERRSVERVQRSTATPTKPPARSAAGSPASSPMRSST